MSITKTIHSKSPMEWPVNTSGDEKPVDDGGAIAGPDQVDVVRVGGRVVFRHSGDQLQDEADVVGLEFKYMSNYELSSRPCSSRC